MLLLFFFFFSLHVRSSAISRRFVLPRLVDGKGDAASLKSKYTSGFSEAAAANLMKQVLEGLQYMHNAPLGPEGAITPVVHCDLKLGLWGFFPPG